MRLPITESTTDKFFRTMRPPGPPEFDVSEVFRNYAVFSFISFWITVSCFVAHKIALRVPDIFLLVLTLICPIGALFAMKMCRHNRQSQFKTVALVSIGLHIWIIINLVSGMGNYPL